MAAGAAPYVSPAPTENPGPAAVMGVQLSSNVIRTSNAPNAQNSQVNVILSSGTTVAWDGRGDSGVFVQNGQYYVEVHSADGHGGDTTVTEKVSVQGADDGMQVVAQPNVLDASKGITDTTFTVNGGLSLTLGVKLYTVAGERVAVLEGPAGQDSVNWNASGLASGVYLAVVEAKDAQGGLALRQIVKVLIIR